MYILFYYHTCRFWLILHFTVIDAKSNLVIHVIYMCNIFRLHYLALFWRKCFPCPWSSRFYSESTSHTSGAKLMLLACRSSVHPRAQRAPSMLRGWRLTSTHCCAFQGKLVEKYDSLVFHSSFLDKKKKEKLLAVFFTSLHCAQQIIVKWETAEKLVVIEVRGESVFTFCSSCVCGRLTLASVLLREEGGHTVPHTFCARWISHQTHTEVCVLLYDSFGTNMADRTFRLCFPGQSLPALSVRAPADPFSSSSCAQTAGCERLQRGQCSRAAEPVSLVHAFQGAGETVRFNVSVCIL